MLVLGLHTRGTEEGRYADLSTTVHPGSGKIRPVIVLASNQEQLAVLAFVLQFHMLRAFGFMIPRQSQIVA